MGNYIQAGYEHKTNPDVVPNPKQEVSKYDPNYGFVQPREPKGNAQRRKRFVSVCLHFLETGISCGQLLSLSLLSIIIVYNSSTI